MIDNRGTTLEYVINLMKKYGMNCLRLGFNILGIYESYPWHTQLDYTKMDNVLKILEENNIYAILDCHHYSDVFIDHKLEWIDKWVEIAQHYKNWSVIAAYELLNEPSGLNATYEITRQNYLDCVDAIRTVDTKHILILGSTSGCTIDQMERVWRPEDIRPNTMYAGHEWTYPRGYIRDRDYVTADAYLKRRVFDPIDNWYATRNAPIFISEFGVVYYKEVVPEFWDYPTEHAETYKTRKMIDYLDGKGIGHLYWTTGMGIKLMVDSGIMDALYYKL
jgi:hypothetical protein